MHADAAVRAGIESALLTAFPAPLLSPLPTPCHAGTGPDGITAEVLVVEDIAELRNRSAEAAGTRRATRT